VAAPAQPLADLQKWLAIHTQPPTVLSISKDFKLILGGAITADFYFNSARPVAPGIPFFLAPGPKPGFQQNTFDATARQSMLFAYFTGPEICGFQSSGLVAVDFYNSSLIQDLWGLLPLLAYGQLKNDNWRFAAGLQLDIFNPLNPNVLPFSRLGASGNTGAFRAQARLERYFHPTEDQQITLTAGLSDPVPTTVNNNFTINEDNGWPNVEGRAAWALGPLAGEGFLAKRPFEIGVSGVVGQMRTTVVKTSQVVANVWGLGMDLRWAVNDRWGVQGEFFIGETLGTYMGGILQNTNSVTFQGIRSGGGWGELYYYICPEKLHAHVGDGVDAPVKRDLAPGQAAFNDTYFANLIWDVTKSFRAAIEFTYRVTDYIGARNNDGFGVQTQFQWKF
jgi:hypothetical protein